MQSGGSPSRPTDAAVLEALRIVAAWLGLGAPPTSTYDAERLPPGITRRAFLDRHARNVRAGVEGWTRVGRARVVTAEAWAKDAEASTRKARARKVTPPTAANDIVDELDAALGIRSRPRKAV
jgi:hypothetical protein